MQDCICLILRPEPGDFCNMSFVKPYYYYFIYSVLSFVHHLNLKCILRKSQAPFKTVSLSTNDPHL